MSSDTDSSGCSDVHAISTVKIGHLDPFPDRPSLQPGAAWLCKVVYPAVGRSVSESFLADLIAFVVCWDAGYLVWQCNLSRCCCTQDLPARQNMWKKLGICKWRKQWRHTRVGQHHMLRPHKGAPTDFVCIYQPACMVKCRSCASNFHAFVRLHGSRSARPNMRKFDVSSLLQFAISSCCGLPPGGA